MERNTEKLKLARNVSKCHQKASYTHNKKRKVDFILFFPYFELICTIVVFPYKLL